MEAIQDKSSQAALTQETPAAGHEPTANTDATDTSLIMRQFINDIMHHGYAVTPHFLPSQQVAELAAEARQLQEEGAMRRAGTGKDTGQVESSIRGDSLHWLEESIGSQNQQQYLHRMETLRGSLNQQLYLGLYDLESHFAIYSPGASYGQHLDQFQGNTQRQVSTILYLNEEWQPEFGGQLRMYLDGTADNPHVDIEPEGGTLVAFLSSRFYHEVLPASRERLSIAGWFSTRSTKGQAPQ